MTRVSNLVGLWRAVERSTLQTEFLDQLHTLPKSRRPYPMVKRVTLLLTSLHLMMNSPLCPQTHPMTLLCPPMPCCLFLRSLGCLINRLPLALYLSNITRPLIQRARTTFFMTAVFSTR